MNIKERFSYLLGRADSIGLQPDELDVDEPVEPPNTDERRVGAVKSIVAQRLGEMADSDGSEHTLADLHYLGFVEGILWHMECFAADRLSSGVIGGKLVFGEAESVGEYDEVNEIECQDAERALSALEKSGDGRISSAQKLAVREALARARSGMRDDLPSAPHWDLGFAVGVLWSTGVVCGRPEFEA
jgi:hypothetical protein